MGSRISGNKKFRFCKVNIYNRMDKIKEEYLYDGSIGSESELSDEMVIWMYEIMKLRKKLYEND